MAEAIAKLFYTNLIKNTPATLTPLTEATDYDADNLFSDNYSEVWRSTAAGASAQTIVADFGAAVSISACALGNVNIRSSATVKIQGHTSDSWGTPDVDETINVSALDGYRRNLYHDLASSYSKRYWRLSVTDNGNPDGFIEIGEWFLGVPITLTDNFAANNTRELVRGNVELRTEYNQAYVFARDYNWMFDLSWENCEVATRNQLRLLNYTLQGNATPFFLVLDPTVPAEAYYVRMQANLQENRVFYNRYNLRAQFLEETPGLIVPR